jgi:hypothetical protein
VVILRSGRHPQRDHRDGGHDRAVIDISEISSAHGATKADPSTAALSLEQI